MIAGIFRLLVLLLGMQCIRAGAQQFPDPPEALFKDLYTAVQMAGVFPDSKEFADAVPRSTPSEILKLYHLEKPRSRLALRRFVQQHFELPQEALSPKPVTNRQPIEERI